MSSDVRAEVGAVLERIRLLVISGYEDHREEVLGELTGLSENHAALRYYLDMCKTRAVGRRLIGAQSFLVFSCAEFYLRLNIWLPEERSRSLFSEARGRYYSIGVCHNHSVDFFTVGLFGSGYSSDFFMTDQNLVGLKAGDKLEFTETRTLQLSKGKAVFVRRDRDFHIQYYPTELSISLNLIPIAERSPAQYTVDMKNRTVEKVLLPYAEANAEAA